MSEKEKPKRTSDRRWHLPQPRGESRRESPEDIKIYIPLLLARLHKRPLNVVKRLQFNPHNFDTFPQKIGLKRLYFTSLQTVKTMYHQGGCIQVMEFDVSDSSSPNVQNPPLGGGSCVVRLSL